VTSGLPTCHQSLNDSTLALPLQLMRTHDLTCSLVLPPMNFYNKPSPPTWVAPQGNSDPPVSARTSCTVLFFCQHLHSGNVRSLSGSPSLSGCILLLLASENRGSVKKKKQHDNRIFRVLIIGAPHLNYR